MSLRVIPSRDSDEPWVIATWLDSYRASRSAGLILDWYEVMYGQIDKLLSLDTTAVIVAINDELDDPSSDGFGWLAYEDLPRGDRILLYCYVKPPFRRMGLADQLLKKAGLDENPRYACKTDLGDKWLREKRGRWTPAVVRRRRDRSGDASLPRQ